MHTRLTKTEAKTLAIAPVRNGQGVVARVAFRPEETIFEVRGVFLSCDEDDDTDEATRANTFRYDYDRYISPKGKIGDFLNHSCNPNAKVVKVNRRLFVQAIRTIRPGSEVVIDYATIIARDDSWTMPCMCGSVYCRGVVKKFKLLPQAVRDRYIKKGIVPSYILEI